MKLPDNPTDEQVEAIALATIRTTFEEGADNLANLDIPGDGSWSAEYQANDQTFLVNWNGESFTKEVKGAGAV